MCYLSISKISSARFVDGVVRIHLSVSSSRTRVYGTQESLQLEQRKREKEGKELLGPSAAALAAADEAKRRKEEASVASRHAAPREEDGKHREEALYLLYSRLGIQESQVVNHRQEGRERELLEQLETETERKVECRQPQEGMAKRNAHEEMCRQDEGEDVPKISAGDLQLDEMPIASGSFKDVYRAELRTAIRSIGPAGLHVAVIRLRAGNSTLGAELNVFRKVGRHPHLTRLLAVMCSDDGPFTEFVTEFAELGSLDNVLMSLEEDGRRATTNVVLTCALQVVDAMLVLQEHKIVHCDVALRNLLAFGFDSEDYSKLVIKLTDYGLASTGTYVKKSTSSVGDGLPYRWMSPETIERRRWSSKSDLWAWAVTLWEMFTHGKVPYTFIASDSEVAQRVVAGHRLERPLDPTECPDGVFDIMQKCWRPKAVDRPTFAEAKTLLLKEFQGQSEGECCVCLDKTLARDMLALVPCGHRCVCAAHAQSVVGRACPLCMQAVREAIRVYD
jgi:hypothetical protein